ncbi:MAG: dTDP-4-dehydrorhamnose reductase [Bacteroidota bacterium]
MKKILVTGASGQVGQELQVLAQALTDWTFLFTDVEKLDITNREMVAEFFGKHQPDFCFNCAAYTAVDKAESEQELANRINKEGAAYLAEACQANGTFLVQLSTDYVYHNDCNRPLVETDPTTPQGVYAATKLGGDLAVLESGADAIVIRTSWVYSSFGHNFVKTMIRLGAERDALRIIFDQVGTPTYARDLAQAMLQVAEQVAGGQKDIAQIRGIYHYSNEGVTSWFDFAQAIFELCQIDCQIEAIETKDYPTPASRPSYSLLNKAKIKSTFGIGIPHWRDGLQRCLKALQVVAE